MKLSEGNINTIIIVLGLIIIAVILGFFYNKSVFDAHAHCYKKNYDYYLKQNLNKNFLKGSEEQNAAYQAMLYCKKR